MCYGIGCVTATCKTSDIHGNGLKKPVQPFHLVFEMEARALLLREVHSLRYLGPPTRLGEGHLDGTVKMPRSGPARSLEVETRSKTSLTPMVVTVVTSLPSSGARDAPGRAQACTRLPETP